MKLIHNGNVERKSAETGENLVAEFTYPASPEEIWELLTTKQGLERWFPKNAHVTPGQDGLIGISWTDEFVWIDRITEWEPHKRLTFKPAELPDSLKTLESLPVIKEDELLPYTISITLEGKGENTTLRLVQSGFLSDDDWDNEIDSFRFGWMHQFTSLEHLLHLHRGDQRKFRRVQTVTKLPANECWNRIVGVEGMIRPESPGSLFPGDSFSLQAGTEIRESTTLVQATELRQMNLNLGGLNNSFLGFGVWRKEEGNWLVMDGNFYGMNDRRADEIAASLQEELEVRAG